MGNSQPKKNSRVPMAANDPRPPDRYREQYGVIIICGNAARQAALYEKLKAAGHKLKVVTT